MQAIERAQTEKIINIMADLEPESRTIVIASASALMARQNIEKLKAGKEDQQHEYH